VSFPAAVPAHFLLGRHASFSLYFLISWKDSRRVLLPRPAAAFQLGHPAGSAHDPDDPLHGPAIGAIGWQPPHFPVSQIREQ